MPSNLIFSFIKCRNECRPLEKNCLISPDDRRSSAWSYSYDLDLSKRCEEALKLEMKSDNSENHAEGNSCSQHNDDEDLDNEFIFQGNDQLEDLVTRVQTIRSWGEVPIESEQEDPCGPKNDFLTKESSNKPISLPLSDEQNLRVWLAKILLHFPWENNDDMNQMTNSKIRAIVVDYLERFIQNNALPAVQKYEKLQEEYWKEKMKWKEQVEFLKRQNCLLKSKFKGLNALHGKAIKELADLKNRIKSKIELRRNSSMSLPASTEIRRSLDFFLKEHMISEFNSRPTPSKSGDKGELIDAKQSFPKRRNQLELEKHVSENDTQPSCKSYKHKRNINRTDPSQLQEKFLENSSQKRRILEEPKNSILAEECRKWNFDFQNNGAKDEQVNQIEGRSYTKSYCLYEKQSKVKGINAKLSQEQRAGLRRGFSMSNGNVTGVKGLNQQKLRDKKPKRDKARESITVNQKTQVIPYKVSQGTQKSLTLHERMSPKTVFLGNDALSFIDFVKLQNEETQPKNLPIRLLNLNEEKTSVDFDKISDSNIVQRLKDIRQHQGRTMIPGNKIPRITVRSKWL